MATGSTTTTLLDGTDVFSLAAAVQPTMFFAVPRTWEKLRQSLTSELEAGAEAEPFRAMLELGRRRVLAQDAGSRLGTRAEDEWQQLNASLGAGIRERLGLDQASWLVTGSARVEPELLRFYAAL